MAAAGAVPAADEAGLALVVGFEVIRGEDQLKIIGTKYENFVSPVNTEWAGIRILPPVDASVDVGVTGTLANRHIAEPRGESFGRALEHFILMELVAHRSLCDLDYEIDFWRAKTGLEVDFVLGGGEMAIEVKGASRVDSRDLRGISAFAEKFSPKQAIVVCSEQQEQVLGPIRIMPWMMFLEKIWERSVIK